jgi:hypothetical protein
MSADQKRARWFGLLYHVALDVTKVFSRTEAPT